MSTATQLCADGIEYLHWVPGKRHFRCEKLSATISSDDCSNRYIRTVAGDERASACRFCPIGAMHSGKTDTLQAASTSARVRIIGSPNSDTRCTRCGRSDLRIIHSGGGLCISCWNRQREWTLGRNASLRQGEVAAIPSMPTARMSVHTAAVWFDLDQDGDGVAVTSEWRPQAMACSSCCIAQIQARRFAGVVECRCPACGSSSTGRSRGSGTRLSEIVPAARGPRSACGNH